MDEFDTMVEQIAESVAEQIDTVGTLKLPEPDLVSIYQNLSERKLWVDLSIDENTLAMVRSILLWNAEDKKNNVPVEERKPIWIYLFNYGGSGDVMWMFTDVISASTTPVYTVNMGQCASAAGLVFMAGHKRFMLKSATVLIHEGSNQIVGDAVKVVDQAESYKAMLKRMKGFISDHTEIPANMLNKRKNNDWELTSDECLKYKVCDVIVENLGEIV